jgi:hypothetical protein
MVISTPPYVHWLEEIQLPLHSSSRVFVASRGTFFRRCTPLRQPLRCPWATLRTWQKHQFSRRPFDPAYRVWKSSGLFPSSELLEVVPVFLSGPTSCREMRPSLDTTMTLTHDPHGSSGERLGAICSPCTEP